MHMRTQQSPSTQFQVGKPFLGPTRFDRSITRIQLLQELGELVSGIHRLLHMPVDAIQDLVCNAKHCFRCKAKLAQLMQRLSMQHATPEQSKRRHFVLPSFHGCARHGTQIPLLQVRRFGSICHRIHAARALGTVSNTLHFLDAFLRQRSDINEVLQFVIVVLVVTE